jgi:hypothetical protein
MSDLIDGHGLARQGEQFAPAGFDFDSWHFELLCELLAQRHGIDPDDAFALNTLVNPHERFGRLLSSPIPARSHSPRWRPTRHPCPYVEASPGQPHAGDAPATGEVQSAPHGREPVSKRRKGRRRTDRADRLRAAGIPCIPADAILLTHSASIGSPRPAPARHSGAVASLGDTFDSWSLLCVGVRATAGRVAGEP